MTQRKLYTVVLEYNGGTYIAQVSENSPAEALPKWLSELRGEELDKWGITREDLAKIIKADDPVVIDGCSGVWCVTGTSRRGLVLINVIATVT